MIDETKPIPGYDGAYSITPDGTVYNKLGRPLKVYPSKFGPIVDLRHHGQRDKVLVSDLLLRVEGDNDDACI